MSTLDVATDELIRLARGVQAAGKALDAVRTATCDLALPRDAFGRLKDSGAVSASYHELQHRLVDMTHQGATLLHGVDRGLHDVAKCYRAQDASAASSFMGG